MKILAKKKGLQKGPFNIQSKNEKNYLTWIGNFGVVPLFLLAFFLFAPIAFFLLSRRFVVTLVLDTIHQLRQMVINIIEKFKVRFLTRLSMGVKVFFLIFIPYLAHADDQKLTLIQGEIYSTPISPKISRIVVGANNAASYSISSNQKLIYFKALRTGYAHIEIWPKQESPAPQVFSINIIEKTHQLAPILKAFRQTRLQTSVVGTQIIVSGKVNSRRDWKLFHQIKIKYKDAIVTEEVSLDHELRNQILVEIIDQLKIENIYQLQCLFIDITPTCRFAQQTPPSESLQKKLALDFFVQFYSVNHGLNAENIKIKIKIVQAEKLDGSEISFGLDKIEGKMASLLIHDFKSFIANNDILFRREKLEFSTLAAPEIVIRPGEDALLQTGAEIPFKAQHANGKSYVDWKFAGVKVELKPELIANRIRLNISSELTQPTIGPSGESEGIQGSKQKSSIFVDFNGAKQFFKIDFKTTSNQKTMLPLFSSIPILGKIFSSSTDHQTYKSIIGIMEIENEN